MDYVPPIGGDPGDPYIDANPGTGTEGSAVPAAALEHAQREIVAAIEAAGLAPDDEDLTQLGQAIQAIAGRPPGLLYGLTLANSGGDADHDIAAATGRCVDSAGTDLLVLAATLTKRIDATWAAGDDAGGLSSSLVAPANDTFYGVFAIRVGGAVDIGFDTSATAANLVADHAATAWRRLGWVRTNGSANIRPFLQRGDLFLLKTGVLDVNTSTLSTARSLQTLTVPPDAIARVRAWTNHGDQAAWIVIQPTAETDAAPAKQAVPGLSLQAEVSGTGGGGSGGQLDVLADASSQVAARANTTNVALTIVTLGWHDTRGRNG